MMTQDIERALAALRTHEAPKDLEMRCLNTIPPNLRTSRSTLFSFNRYAPQRWAIAAIALVAVVSLMNLWQRFEPRNATGIHSMLPLEGMALADSVDALNSAPYWHATCQQLGFYPGGSEKQGKWQWYSPYPFNTETWFDGDHGLYSRSWGETIIATSDLQLPDGAMYFRTGDAMKKTTLSPGYWRQSVAMLRLLDPATLFAGVNSNAPVLVAANRGELHGRATTIFSYISKPTASDAEKGAPTLSAEVIVDAATKLPLEVHQAATYPDGTQQHVLDTSFDYNARPNPEIFDPNNIKQGVVETEIGHGGQDENLGPDANTVERIEEQKEEIKRSTQ